MAGIAWDIPLNQQELTPRELITQLNEITALPAAAIAAKGGGVALSPPTTIQGTPYLQGGIAFYANAYNGVDPTGVTDSTTGLQTCFTAAIAAKGKVVLNGSYTTSSTLTLQPASGGQFLCDIDGGGPHTGTPGSEIYYNANTGAVFKALGWKQSLIRSVRINTNTTANPVIGWDLDCDGTRTSLGQLNFENCFVNLVTGSSNCVGWRMGHAGGGTGDISDLQWFGCFVQGNVNNVGHIGWLNEHANGLHYAYFGGGPGSCAMGFSNTATAGAVGNGNGGQMFYGWGTSGNAVDFDFRVVGEYNIIGGRFEDGQKFLQTPSQSGSMIVTCVGVEIGNYTPGDNIVFNMLTPGSLTLVNCMAVGQNYTAAFITTGGFTGNGKVMIIGGGIRSLVDPIFTLASNWSAYVLGVGRLDSSNRAVNQFADRMGAFTGSFSPTYGATVTPDLTFGRKQKIAVTNGTAFTIAAVTGAYDGAELDIEVFNNSGGAMGVITWDASFLFVNGAWANPASTKRRSIRWLYNSTISKWTDQYRATADY